jgi:RimJ/RimL family protein N-acetyltransferase
MNAPDRLTTARLLLRRPLRSDAELIFSRYASDPEVTKFLGWPRHTSIEDTQSFLDFSDKEWERWPAGPYLIENAKDGRLLGSTGLNFEAPDRVMTGYAIYLRKKRGDLATQPKHCAQLHASEMLWRSENFSHSATEIIEPLSGFWKNAASFVNPNT